MSDLPDESAVREAIADFPDPETGRPLAETGQLGPLRVQADKIGVAECDDFIDKYEACITGKVPEAARAQVPGSTIPTVG